MTTTFSKAMRIRSVLGHPVIDADGHTVEVTPVLLDYLKDLGGTDALGRLQAYNERWDWVRGSLEIRRDRWPAKTLPTWVWPARTLDRATASLPRLYHERMEELGLDFSIVYPSLGLKFVAITDDELRPLACRAQNIYMAEMHRGLEDRLLPVAAVPMNTPEEGIAELEYIVNVLGMRAVVIPSFVCRPIPNIHRSYPELDEDVFRFDTYGIDSEYDYDPFWAKCIELGVVPGVHSSTHGFGFRRSPSNYVYTHIGSFATSCEALSKSLILGGVFHRFPELKVAALEGGVGWAASLYADFLSHWQKRNGKVIEELNPARLDRELLRSLVSTYGADQAQLKLDSVLDDITSERYTPDSLDDFSACPFDTPEEIRDLFTSHIYIGCEADDPMNALAFNSKVNPYGARFRTLFGSDISHWDVPDVSEVLEEAYEMVEHDLITEGDFREFTFSNAARLYAGCNPDFFKGTAVEGAVADLLRADSTQS
jgi:predicted TIM-barrel fold metal-dependent hydrolase